MKNIIIYYDNCNDTQIEFLTKKYWQMNFMAGNSRRSSEQNEYSSETL